MPSTCSSPQFIFITSRLSSRSTFSLEPAASLVSIKLNILENTPTSSSIYPGGILNVPLAPGKSSSVEWRAAFSNLIFPRLAEFKPDFIFVSAGFDAHEGDTIHCMDSKVTEFDYHWVT